MRGFSPGKVFCLVLCPLRPDPCQKYCLLSSLSLSLSLFVCLVGSSATLALFLFLSGAGVWGSPCVSASWPRSSSWIRTPCSASTPRSPPRACVFFSSSSFVGLVVVRLGLSVGCWVGGLSRFWWVAACSGNAFVRETGQPDYHLAPQLSPRLFFG